jgi:DNA helicase-2/ATP-dependent DNA helicase PcrA
MVGDIDTPTEVEQVMGLIAERKNFLLSGGAGSGKTYSLVEVICSIRNSQLTARIACLTYTNAAVRMIEGRIGGNNLKVGTIHDFLWDCLKTYQRDLKISLAEMINSEAYNISHPDGQILPEHYLSFDEPIRYKQIAKIADGIIAHDEVILLGAYMFKKYPRLIDILKDRFDFIFIDEYQDTDPKVVELLLKDLNLGYRDCIVGFFGDAMQGIYDDGVGDVRSYIEEGLITEVRKLQNRRNPQAVITLANQLRNDGLEQQPSKDPDAPNMINGVVKPGEILFVYSDLDDLSEVKNKINWQYQQDGSMRELNLTHNLIAGKAGFEPLMDIFDRDPVISLKKAVSEKLKAAAKKGTPYSLDEVITFDEVVKMTEPRDIKKNLKRDIIIQNYPELYAKVKDRSYEEVKKIYLDKDQLVDDKKESTSEENRTGSKRGTLIKHLFKIYDIVKLYQEKRYNEFIRNTHYPIGSISDKRELLAIVEALSTAQDKSIAEVITLANSSGICVMDDKVREHIQVQDYAYSRIGEVPFSVFVKLYDYLEGFTPFSTQHKIKGDEFSEVLVVLEDGGWSKYNFMYLFNKGIYDSLDKSKQKSFPNIRERTLKLFYVCCTRAKERLVVFYHQPSPEVIATAEKWFDGNIVEIN